MEESHNKNLKTQRTDSFRLYFGEGTISVVISLALSILCFLSVLAFRFPEYLTTPELREIYTASFARSLLFASIIVSAVFAIINIILSKRIRYASLSFGLLVLTLLLGGYNVPVSDVRHVDVYFGLDFFILNLLVFSFLFIFIEKLWGHRKNQLIFRSEWRTDLFYFAFNHILIGVFLIIVNSFIAQFTFAMHDGVHQFVRALHPVIQFLSLLLVADIIQYWSHRAYHEIPFLWKFHAVHHSSKEMDWLAGSRVHVVELLLTRMFVLLPIFLLGFDTAVVNAYVVFVAFQAVFDHANVSVNPGFFRYIIVTPNFHHWHHSQDKEALDRNYAVHFSFLDYLFGTAVNSQKMWPEKYGVLGDYIPLGFVKQFIFPFASNLKSVEERISKNFR